MFSYAHKLLKIAFCMLLGLQFAVLPVWAGVPDFINGSIYSSNKAKVSTIEPTLAADLVILEGGLDHGLRLGMACLLERGVESIGELIIIEAKSNCSAALITELKDGFVIQPGDNVRIKTTFQNS